MEASGKPSEGRGPEVTERTVYIVRRALEQQFGIWPSDDEVRAWLDYLARIKLKIVEASE